MHYIYTLNDEKIHFLWAPSAWKEFSLVGLKQMFSLIWNLGLNSELLYKL